MVECHPCSNRPCAAVRIEFPLFAFWGQQKEKWGIAYPLNPHFERELICWVLSIVWPGDSSLSITERVLSP